VVGLNAQGAAWLARSPAGVAYWRYLPWPGASPSQAMELLRSQLAVTAAPRTQLVLAPSLVRHWLQTPPAQIASLRELRSVATARCAQLFGTPASTASAGNAWSVSANWHASAPFVCTAIASAWADALERKLPGTHQGHDLVALALQAQQRHIPRSGWLAVVLANTLYLVRLEHQRIVTLRSLRMAAQASASQTQQTAVEEWTREMLRTQMHTPVLHWLCLMPQVAGTAHLPSLQVLPWEPSPQIPTLPQSLGELETQDIAAEHVQEVLSTAWCALHSLGRSR
jgi:hypothetical protein